MANIDKIIMQAVDYNSLLTEHQLMLDALERIGNYKCDTLTDQYYATARLTAIARECVEKVRKG